MNILVLHGPNLNLLGERPGDDKSHSLPALDAALRKRAQELGAEVRIQQSNHEGVLVDALHEARAWADAVVINPGALTHTSYVLREALAAIGKPAIEVHLTDIRRRESWRRKSVIKDVCVAQVMGKGFESYLQALEKLAKVKVKAPAAKAKKNGKAAAPRSIGRKASEPAAAVAQPHPPRAAPEKSLGRKAPPAPNKVATPAADFLTRALVRQKIADRLGGKLSPSGLSTWARSKWLDVQRGAPAESGHRELLEETLQNLVLAAMPPSRMTDEQLIDLMTQLEG